MRHWVGDLLGSDTIGSSPAGYSSGVSGSLSYAQTVAADSPVGYWRLGEPSGTNAAAVVGTDGTYANAPTLAVAGALAGDANTAVTFNGTNQRVLISAVPLTAIDNFTIECWVKCASWAGNKSAIGVGSGVTGYHLWFQAGAPRGLTGAGSGMTDAAAALSINTWYHVALRRLSGISSVWVNGVQYDPGTNNTGAGTTPTTSTEIASFAGTNWFAGTIDEVALYATALTSTRLLAHYTKGFSG